MPGFSGCLNIGGKISNLTWIAMAAKKNCISARGITIQVSLHPCMHLTSRPSRGGENPERNGSRMFEDDFGMAGEGRWPGGHL